MSDTIRHTAVSAWTKSQRPHEKDIMHQYDHNTADAKIKQIRFVPSTWPHTANICVKFSSLAQAKAFVAKTDDTINVRPSTGVIESINEYIYFLSPNHYPETLEKLPRFLRLVSQFEPDFKESMLLDLEGVLRGEGYQLIPEEELTVQFKNLSLKSQDPLVKKIENMKLDDTSEEDELCEKFILRLRFK